MPLKTTSPHETFSDAIAHAQRSTGVGLGSPASACNPSPSLLYSYASSQNMRRGEAESVDPRSFNYNSLEHVPVPSSSGDTAVSVSRNGRSNPETGPEVPLDRASSAVGSPSSPSTDDPEHPVGTTREGLAAVLPKTPGSADVLSLGLDSVSTDFLNDIFLNDPCATLPEHPPGRADEGSPTSSTPSEYMREEQQRVGGTRSKCMGPLQKERCALLGERLLHTVPPSRPSSTPAHPQTNPLSNRPSRIGSTEATSLSINATSLPLTSPLAWTFPIPPSGSSPLSHPVCLPLLQSVKASGRPDVRPSTHETGRDISLQIEKAALLESRSTSLGRRRVTLPILNGRCARLDMQDASWDFSASVPRWLPLQSETTDDSDVCTDLPRLNRKAGDDAVARFSLVSHGGKPPAAPQPPEVIPPEGMMRPPRHSDERPTPVMQSTSQPHHSFTSNGDVGELSTSGIDEAGIVWSLSSLVSYNLSDGTGTPVGTSLEMSSLAGNGGDAEGGNQLDLPEGRAVEGHFPMLPQTPPSKGLPYARGTKAAEAPPARSPYQKELIQLQTAPMKLARQGPPGYPAAPASVVPPDTESGVHQRHMDGKTAEPLWRSEELPTEWEARPAHALHPPPRCTVRERMFGALSPDQSPHPPTLCRQRTNPESSSPTAKASTSAVLISSSLPIDDPPVTRRPAPDPLVSSLEEGEQPPARAASDEYELLTTFLSPLSTDTAQDHADVPALHWQIDHPSAETDAGECGGTTSSLTADREPSPLRSILVMSRVFDPQCPRPRAPRTRTLPDGIRRANWVPPPTNYITTLADWANFDEEEEEEEEGREMDVGRELNWNPERVPASNTLPLSPDSRRGPPSNPEPLAQLASERRAVGEGRVSPHSQELLPCFGLPVLPETVKMTSAHLSTSATATAGEGGGEELIVTSLMAAPMEAVGTDSTSGSSSATVAPARVVNAPLCSRRDPCSRSRHLRRHARGIIVDEIERIHRIREEAMRARDSTHTPPRGPPRSLVPPPRKDIFSAGYRWSAVARGPWSSTGAAARPFPPVSLLVDDAGKEGTACVSAVPTDTPESENGSAHLNDAQVVSGSIPSSLCPSLSASFLAAQDVLLSDADSSLEWSMCERARRRRRNDVAGDSTMVDKGEDKGSVEGRQTGAVRSPRATIAFAE